MLGNSYCMEVLGKKRKGPEALTSCDKSLNPFSIPWCYLSLKDYSGKTKKCKANEAGEHVGCVRSVVKGILTASPCQNACLDTLSRGLKRKIGCINRETQLGRNKRIEQDYDLGATIGQGKFGSVVLCRSKASGEEFACKRLPKGEELVHQEVEIMQHLSGHPGIVTLKAVYEDLESFFLVMELCHGGRLLDQMAKERQYSEYQAASILKELVLVIKYCHEMGVVHRDIKPENVLLTASGEMKLADFGLAVRMSTGQSLTGLVGSPAYVAPEVLLGKYSEKVDIWSAGVLLHALLVSALPFQGDTLQSVFEAVKNAELDFQSGVWQSVSQPARHLVEHLLTRDVSIRLTAEEVLRHPWILFYTEPRLETATFEPRIRKHARVMASQQVAIFPGTVLEMSKECGLVDALAAAISHIRISEPKRSMLFGPTDPIQQECPANIKANNLCAAF